MRHVLSTEERLARFWDNVDKSGDCWLWKSAAARGGYGVFLIAPYTQRPAHRVAWELTHGPIPDGMLICHHCDNPPCVRPEHLFLGTHSDNARDKVAKHRDKPWYWRDHHEQLIEREVLEILGITHQELMWLTLSKQLHWDKLGPRIFGPACYYRSEVEALKARRDREQ